MPKSDCSICGGPRKPLHTANNETWICTNCDQYPWMVNPMTEQQVMDQDARASKIARGGR